nr:hypothetical protein CFP56_10397 [Quercus suber]
MWLRRGHSPDWQSLAGGETWKARRGLVYAHPTLFPEVVARKSACYTVWAQNDEYSTQLTSGVNMTSLRASLIPKARRGEKSRGRIDIYIHVPALQSVSTPMGILYILNKRP